MAIIDQPTNARSRRTRAALLDGARSILEAHGFSELTMAAAADRAGVTRRAAYLHFASRSALVAALFDHIAEKERLPASLQQVAAAPDALAALDAWANHLARYHPRLIAIERAITQVESHDPDAAAHRARVSAAQRANCVGLAKRLAHEGKLARPWNVRTASDLLFGLISTDMIARLLTDCAWSERELGKRLALLFRRTLVEPD
jgi:AcrR family transcriptional regulator